MEIVIESEPHYTPQQRPSSACATTYLRSPVSATPPTQQPLISTGNAFYYATLPRGRPANPTPNSVDVPDGAPITSSVRRVDKSGLLEIAELEPPPPPRRTLVDSCGSLSRRLERPGLLESVPELPDAQQQQCSTLERQKHQLVGAEPEILASKPRTGPRVKFATDEITSVGAEVLPPPPPPASVRKSSVADCLGRLSPRQRGDRPQMTLSSIPDVIEAHETNTGGGGGGGSKPEGERAEAEGCEHSGALDAVEEARIQSQTATATKTAVNDANANNNNGGNPGGGLQAVHVIILSEQL